MMRHERQEKEIECGLSNVSITNDLQ